MADAPILITGGAGFIGSHLCDALLDKGYAVRILDDLSTGKRSNLQVDHPRLELIEGDVADAALVARAAAAASAVVHLAAVASVQASVEDPVRTHQSNFIGTLNVCEAMRSMACAGCCSPPARRCMATMAKASRSPKTRPRRR
jgi:UDP-glucose 4-epimerase